MDTDESEPVDVPRQVYCELKTLRQMGTHDMTSGEVLDGLDAYNFGTAREWVLDNPEAYIQVVYEGMPDGNPSADEA